MSAAVVAGAEGEGANMRKMYLLMSRDVDEEFRGMH